MFVLVTGKLLPSGGSDSWEEMHTGADQEGPNCIHSRDVNTTHFEGGEVVVRSEEEGVVSGAELQVQGEGSVFREATVQ